MINNNSSTLPQIKPHASLQNIVLFQTPVKSDFSVFLEEVVAFWHRYPNIQVAITSDLDAKALEEKRLRIQDKEFEEQQRTQSLFTDADLLASKEVASKAELKLASGRPRTPSLVVFIAAMMTGFQGSLYGSPQWTLLKESMSLRSLLDHHGYTLPAPNTLGPLIGHISEATLVLIHRAQLADVLEEGLDAFDKICIDSTAVKASSCWPTDSSVIYRLFERACRLGRKLDRFGLKPLADDKAMDWLNELQRTGKAIALLGSGKHREKRLKELYRDYFLCATNLSQKLLGQVREMFIESEKHLPQLCPSRRKQAQTVVDTIWEDISAAIKTLEQSIKRIEKGISAKARERVLSLADKSAAYIEKGGRQAVIGYKAQLARSDSGFVTALILEEGNGADSGKLLPLTQETIQNTQKIPSSLSSDDGYSSQAGLEAVLKLGVKKVSISGSKGRALLGEVLWNSEDYVAMRSNRSAIESLMFTLKCNHRFGKLGRCGIEAVRSELTLKIIAYNFDRMIFVRKQNANVDEDEVLESCG